MTPQLAGRGSPTLILGHAAAPLRKIELSILNFYESAPLKIYKYAPSNPKESSP